MTTPNTFRASTATIALAGLFLALPASAHGPSNAAGNEKITALHQRALQEAPGKQVQMITVDYAPGQASTPHIHSGTVYAYVLEGAVVSRLGGEQKEVTYRAGQHWYEPPETPHLVSRNASTSKRARLLVWLVTGEDEPVKRPYPEK